VDLLMESRPSCHSHPPCSHVLPPASLRSHPHHSHVHTSNRTFTPPFKPSLRYDYPLTARHSASRPIMDRELIMVFSSTNQGR
jgi:hypothetical protein